MSWKTFGLALVVMVALWSAMVVYVSRPTPRRTFVAYMGDTEYRVEADEFQTEGFCTVFYRSDVRFAAVCGQHTVSEALEVE